MKLNFIGAAPFAPRSYAVHEAITAKGVYNIYSAYPGHSFYGKYRVTFFTHAGKSKVLGTVASHAAAVRLAQAHVKK